MGCPRAQCAYVFRDHGKLPIGDFRKAWRNACRAASLEGTLVHDMRRSCARNLVRSGVNERVAMAVTGHKTRSMFDRYNIVGANDLEQAMERVSEYVTAKESEPTRNKVVQLRPQKVA